MINPIEAALRDRIAAEGPIGLDVFMEAANNAYYAGGDVIGAGGDFITAPEISQCFGELVGLWAAVCWQTLGAPASFNLVELGPGRGTLMADALRAAVLMPGFGASAQLHLVERSPGLRNRQRRTLTGREIRWHDSLASVPAGPTITIANEFLDALPIRQWEFTDRWNERRIGCEGGHFRFALAPTARTVPAAATAGSIYEDSPAVDAVVGEIAARLVRDGGAALLIDYGYASGHGDTLQAVHRHKAADALAAPGTRDLTAHVDFAAVAAAAARAGAKVFGPVEQGAWLRRLGIEVRAEKLAQGKSADSRDAILGGVRRLTDARAMGSLFKVMALTQPSVDALEGFAKDSA